MKQTILNLWRDNETLLMIIQKHIMMQEMKVSIIQNFKNLKSKIILVRGDITVIAACATQVRFKNCAPFTKCITKIDGTTANDAEDLDLIIIMYNLIEYSSNYSETTGNFWFYSKDEATNFNVDFENTDDFKYFKYKAKLIGNTVAEVANGILKMQQLLSWNI